MMLMLRIQRRSEWPEGSFFGVSMMLGTIVQSANRRNVTTRTKIYEKLTLLVAPSGEAA